MAKNFRGNLVGNQWDDVVDPSISKDRYVGIELEVENAPGLHLGEPESKTQSPMEEAPNWYAIKDNSLRNYGAEFVSVPLPISEVAMAVRQLFKFKIKHGFNWVGSVRTGIHVHVNVRDFGAPQLQNFLVTFPLVEPALFSYVGKEREECIYCVPWYRAPGDAKHAAMCLEDGKNKPFSKRLRNMTNGLAKYSSLFLAPITRIGTVEFRMAPTWLDQDKIVEWITICERIVSYAAKCSTYYNILDNFDADPQKFVKTATGGLLTVPPAYGAVVTKLGADLLARNLFPEYLEEWVRLSDKYFPTKIKPTYTSPYLGGYKPPQSTTTKVGDTKQGSDGIVYIWNGAKWLENIWTIPDGYTQYLGHGKYKKWNKNLMVWEKISDPSPLQQINNNDMVATPPTPQVVATNTFSFDTNTWSGFASLDEELS